MMQLNDLQQSKTQTFIKVPQSYLHNLNLTIKHLTKLLKMRLRTEYPESYSILNELNERVVPLVQCSQKILQYFSQMSDNAMERVKQDAMELRLNELETSYTKEIKVLVTENHELQEQLFSLRDKVQIMQNLLKDSSTLTEKLKEKLDYVGQELQIKDADINKLNQEKQTLKNQHMHLQTLVKQINAEKSVNESDNRLQQLRDEIDIIKGEFNRKIDQRDQNIQVLEREIQLVKQEAMLNDEFRDLNQQSSHVKESINKDSTINKESSVKKNKKK